MPTVEVVLSEQISVAAFFIRCYGRFLLICAAVAGPSFSATWWTGRPLLELAAFFILVCIGFAFALFVGALVCAGVWRSRLPMTISLDGRCFSIICAGQRTAASTDCCTWRCSRPAQHPLGLFIRAHRIVVVITPFGELACGFTPDTFSMWTNAFVSMGIRHVGQSSPAARGAKIFAAALGGVATGYLAGFGLLRTLSLLGFVGPAELTLGMALLGFLDGIVIAYWCTATEESRSLQRSRGLAWGILGVVLALPTTPGGVYIKTGLAIANAVLLISVDFVCAHSSRRRVGRE